VKINKKDLKPETLKDFDISKLVNNLSENLGYISNRSELNLFFNAPKLSYLIKNLLPYIGNVQYQKKIIPVNEYKKLITQIKITSQTLYEEEYIYSKEKIFKNNLHPLEIVHNVIPFYAEELKEYQKNILLFMKTILKLSQHYDIEDVLTEGHEDDLEFLKTVLIALRNHINRRDFIGLFKYIKGKVESLKTTKKTNKFQEELINNCDRIIEDIIEQKKRRISFSNDMMKYIGSILKMVKDIDSHIILFCRYFCRLYHITRFNNREYNGKFYDVSSKFFDRIKFVELLTNNFRKNYPRLFRFLYFYTLRFRDLRNIEAHEIIANCKYLRNKELIIIPKTLKHSKIRLNVNKTVRDILDYSQFINRLDLHQKSPSNIDDTTFMKLE